ncbi:hypothetical protein [Deinococcus multiflagellatus]|uniref:Uncharacterized protein n=1 Tax=Deinococcus multiflagellatus TaxID=1656887 RepID=A0ABW1ZLU8_9DEIO
MGAYEDAVLDYRRRKDEHFAAGGGPVDAATFQGLSYYPRMKPGPLPSP